MAEAGVKKFTGKRAEKGWLKQGPDTAMDSQQTALEHTLVTASYAT